MPVLAFPNHFPPTDRWKRFFIGVRWLGPDLSFFRELKALQSKREPACMEVWGTGVRKELAEGMSRILSQQLGWKTPYFLPEDHVNVAFHGPSFDFTDPESAFEAVEEFLKERFGIARSAAFWHQHEKSTLGQLIDALLVKGDA